MSISFLQCFDTDGSVTRTASNPACRIYRIRNSRRFSFGGASISKYPCVSTILDSKSCCLGTCQCHKTRKCLSVDLRFVSAGVLSPSSWKRCLSRFFGATWSNRPKNRPVKQKPKGSKGKKISPAFYRLSLKRWRSGVVTRGGERNTRTGSAE